MHLVVLRSKYRAIEMCSNSYHYCCYFSRIAAEIVTTGCGESPEPNYRIAAMARA